MISLLIMRSRLIQVRRRQREATEESGAERKQKNTKGKGNSNSERQQLWADSGAASVARYLRLAPRADGGHALRWFPGGVRDVAPVALVGRSERPAWFCSIRTPPGPAHPLARLDAPGESGSVMRSDRAKKRTLAVTRTARSRSSTRKPTLRRARPFLGAERVWRADLDRRRIRPATAVEESSSASSGPSGARNGKKQDRAAAVGQ